MENSEQPAFTPLNDGPLMLTGLETLYTDEGDRPIGGKAVLCRCGHSSNKPFCDGSHKNVNFSSLRVGNDGDERLSFGEGKLRVYENVAICAHAGFCDRGRPDEWRERGRTDEEIMTMCTKCPSGALSYAVDGEEFRDESRPPKVTVKKNGPIWVEGGVELRNTQNWGEGASKEHYTLCRCGASTMKPFCDGSHDKVWKDGETGWGGE